MSVRARCIGMGRVGKGECGQLLSSSQREVPGIGGMDARVEVISVQKLWAQGWGR